MTLLSSVLALWTYHLAPISAQIRNKDTASALRVHWRITHQVNDPTSGTIIPASDKELERRWFSGCCRSSKRRTRSESSVPVSRLFETVVLTH